MLLPYQILRYWELVLSDEDKKEIQVDTFEKDYNKFFSTDLGTIDWDKLDHRLLKDGVTTPLDIFKDAFVRTMAVNTKIEVKATNKGNVMDPFVKMNSNDMSDTIVPLMGLDTESLIIYNYSSPDIRTPDLKNFINSKYGNSWGVCAVSLSYAISETYKNSINKKKQYIGLLEKIVDAKVFATFADTKIPIIIPANVLDNVFGVADFESNKIGISISRFIPDTKSTLDNAMKAFTESLNSMSNNFIKTKTISDSLSISYAIIESNIQDSTVIIDIKTDHKVGAPPDYVTLFQNLLNKYKIMKVTPDCIMNFNTFVKKNKTLLEASKFSQLITGYMDDLKTMQIEFNKKIASSGTTHPVVVNVESIIPKYADISKDDTKLIDSGVRTYFDNLLIELNAFKNDLDAIINLFTIPNMAYFVCTTFAGDQIERDRLYKVLSNIDQVTAIGDGEGGLLSADKVAKRGPELVNHLFRVVLYYILEILHNRLDTTYVPTIPTIAQFYPPTIVRVGGRYYGVNKINKPVNPVITSWYVLILIIFVVVLVILLIYVLFLGDNREKEFIEGCIDHIIDL
jgi:hypothetical protein